MEAYRDWDISESRGEVSEVRKFLEEKLKDVQDELTASEEALKEYKETEKVTELTAETQQTIEQLAGFETIYQAAKTDLEANQKRLAHLRSNLSESQRVLVEEAASISSPVVKQLEVQLAQLIGRRAALEKQVTEAGLSSEYGNLNDLDRRIEGIKEKIIEETKKIVEGGISPLHTLDYSESIITNILQIETDNKALVARIDYLAGIVEQYNRELNVLPEKSLKLARLRRETTVNNNIFMMLREKYEENRIAEAGQIGSVRIVDRAKPPTSPIKPRKRMNLFLGVMVGLGLGMGLTFLREYLDNSLKSIEDVERLGFSVLGSIPFISPQKMAPHSKDQNGDILRIESRLITHFAPKSPISEAYRTLRTNLQYAKADRPIKTILVTSSGPGEGKSTSVANLAITFAQMGSKTLIIDTDLRRPVLHAIFDQSRTTGLTNILIGKTTLQEVVRSTKIENLDLLVSGTLPPNPSELLASKAMDKVLKAITDQYDIVLFDSPPVIAVTDAAVLARKLDGIVLVVKSGETSRDAILRSRVLLENVNAHIFGVMLNGVKSDHMYGSYYYYYHHYYYYGDGKHKKRKSRKALV
jgi:tyrosine-protein kinase Etk/Wzc